MRLDYEQLAECVELLVGTDADTLAVVKDVAYPHARAGDIENLSILERAAPVCSNCGIRGLGAAMFHDPELLTYWHKICPEKGEAPA